MPSEAALNLIVRLRDEASGAMQRLTGQVESLSSRFNVMNDSAMNLSKGVTALVGGGLLAVGGGIAAAAASGISFNSTMEQTTARLNAFTKDGAKSAEILEMIRERAAKTPFAFTETAQATAGLLPAAQASGQAIEDLVSQAEILAASNPAQGLEGAAYALREAVGGDFVSLIDRFDIPRQMINDLKEQGLPNIEIVRQAMQGMGLDADLVSNMAETMSGRWSTFTDTLQGIAATATGSLFEGLSSGLGNLNTLMETAQPQLEAIATVVGERLASALQTAISVAQGFVTHWNTIKPVLIGVAATLTTLMVPAIYTGVTALGAAVVAAAPFIAIAGAIGLAVGALYAAWNTNFLGIQDRTREVFGFIQQAVQPVVQALSRFWTEIQPQLAAAWQNIQRVTQTVLSGIVGFVTANMGTIQTIFAGVWTAMQGVVQIAWSLISGIIKTGLSVLSGDWRGAWENIKRTAEGVWEGFKTYLSGAWEAIKGIVKLGVDALPGIVRGVVGALQRAGAALVDGLKAGISGAWGRFTGWIEQQIQKIPKVVRDVLGIDSPSRVMAEIGGQLVEGLVVGMNDKQQDAISKAAELTQKIAGAVSAAIDAVTKLNAYEGQGITGLDASFITHSIYIFVKQIEDVASYFKVKGLEAASGFADHASKVVSLISTGIDAITKINDYKGQGVTALSAAFLTNATFTLVKQIQDVAGHFKTEGLAHAAAFSEHAQKIVSMVGNALTVLTALGKAEITDIPGPAMQVFVGALVRLVVQMQEAFQDFAADAFEQTAAFMESVGKILAPIKTAVEAFNALTDLAPIPPTRMQILAANIALAYHWMHEISKGADTEGLPATVAFSEAIGKIFGAIKVATDTMSNLLKIETIPAERMQTLAANIYQAYWWMNEIRRGADVDGLPATIAFSEAIQKVFGAIKSATDTMTGLLKIEGIPPERFQTFKDNFFNAVAMMADIGRAAGGMRGDAERWRDDMIALADAMAEGIRAIQGIPSIPAVPAPPNAPALPSFASGITNFAGGFAKVHAGEVITYLPRGSNVYTAAEARGMGGDTHYHYTTTINGVFRDDAPESVADRLRTEAWLRRRR